MILFECENFAVFAIVTTFIKSKNNIEPQHEISNNVECATSKGSDQPVHMPSLIRAFTSRLSIL